MQVIIDYIVANWVWLSIIVAEIALRLWPTKWNVSILDNILKLINLLITNRRAPDGTENLSPSDSSKNVIAVPVNHHVIV